MYYWCIDFIAFTGMLELASGPVIVRSHQPRERERSEKEGEVTIIQWQQRESSVARAILAQFLGHGRWQKQKFEVCCFLSSSCLAIIFLYNFFFVCLWTSEIRLHPVHRRMLKLARSKYWSVSHNFLAQFFSIWAIGQEDSIPNNQESWLYF